MKTEEILNQLYLSANDLMILIPNLNYKKAIKYINEAQEEMREKNYFVPESRTKVALTKILRKKFGF